MTDVVDQAEARIDQERAALSSRVSARVQRSGTPECVECGEYIPLARQAAAPFATRCIHCQEEFERGA